MSDLERRRAAAIRMREKALRLTRYCGLGLMGLAVGTALLGLGLLFTPSAPDAPEILAMAGLAFVCGAGAYAIARSAGPPITPEELTVDALNERVARMMYRNIIFVVFVLFWAMAVAVFLATARR